MTNTDQAQAQPAVSVVLPIFNEADSLPSLLDELAAALDPLALDYEVLAVDDGSTDGSRALLRERQAKDPRLRVVEFRRNFGQTAAFQAGFDLCRGRVVVTLDADGQNDPNDIPRLLAKLDEGYDIVSGWRVNRPESFFVRRLPSLVANRLIARTTGARLHDTGCSLKAYRSEVVKNVQLYGELHRFIPALTSWMGVRVAEIPVNHRARSAGRSKYDLGRTSRVLLDLLTVYFLLSYAGRPMQLFGGLGLVTFGAGAAIGLYLTGLKLGYGQSIGDRPLLLLAILLMTFGVQLLTTGLVAELITRSYHEARGQKIYALREPDAPPGPDD